MTLIEFDHVSKYYGSLRANDDLCFKIDAGSIHAVIGENGAGKSTAMKLLAGLEVPTSGTIKLRGVAVSMRSPVDARSYRIGMVHQHFMLSMHHSALDNMVLATTAPRVASAIKRLAPCRLDRNSFKTRLEALCKELNFSIPWQSLCQDLSVGQLQQIEILKVLEEGTEIFIFDEPTAVLSPQETERFLELLKHLKSLGKTIVLITHKLKEVLQVADAATVLRSGQVVQTVDLGAQGSDIHQLSQMMIGDKAQPAQAIKTSAECREVLLHVEGLSLISKKGARPLLTDVSLRVHRGEIVGLAGIEGNGQRELFDVLCLQGPPKGYAFSTHTNYTVRGKSVIRDKSDALRCHGMAAVPTDRLQQAVLPQENLCENNLLGYLHEFTKLNFIRRKKALKHTEAIVKNFAVEPERVRLPLTAFSGGNQQKFVMGRELVRMPDLFLCAEPTRGVDMGACQKIYRHLHEAARRGAGVLVLSSQLDELMDICDRILVLFDGRISGEFKRCEKSYDEKAIGRVMLGGQQ